MRAVTSEALDQAKQEIREKKDRRNTYVKNWRQTTRRQKRVCYFVEEYVREKFHSVYSEALNFYTVLDVLYPQKIDLRKTVEFRRWKQTLADGNDSETPVIPPDEPGQNQAYSSHSIDEPDQLRDDNMVLRIPLLPQPSSPQTSPSENPSETSIETPPEIPPPQPLTPPEVGAELTVEMPPLELLAGPENIDQHIQEIIEELQNDPDLEGIFDNLQSPGLVDEGIEVADDEMDFYQSL